MRTFALVVGIDGYATDPLQSAVADASRFHDALLRLNLAGKDEVALLTSPVEGEQGATFEAIREQIVRLGREGADIDRLIFYFAGHGILASRGPGTSKSVTALLPSDLESLETDAHRLLVVEDILSALKLAGPREQFYFVDACRNMPYEHSPEIGSLGFQPAPPGPPRSQSVLYAVSELGQARASSEEGGEMTGHLLDALEGKGCALDYSSDLGQYVITVESVSRYVQRRFTEGGRDPRPAEVPTLDRSDPAPRPLWVLEDPPPRSRLTVHVDPPAAGPETRVRVGLGEIEVCQWPPADYGAPVELPPRPYQLAASSSAGAVDPRSCSIDVREVDQATVRILSEPPGEEAGMRVQISSPPQISPQRAALIRGEDVEGAADASPLEGSLSVTGGDDFHAIDVVGLEPPYERVKAFGSLERVLPAGTYQVDVRVGPEVASSRRIFVGDGTEVEVELPAGLELWPEGYGEPPAAMLRRLSRDLLAQLADESGPQVGVIAAIEDPRGEHDVRAASEVQEMTVTASGRFAAMQTEVESMRMPWGAVGTSRLSLGEQPFQIAIETPQLGQVAFASAAVDGYRTAVVVRIGRHREIDVSQYLVRPWAEGEELVRLQLAQQLYKSGELLSARGVGSLLRWAAEGRRDPLLACMALYAAVGAGSKLSPSVRSGVREVFSSLSEARGSSLPDASIALASMAPEERADLLEPLLESGEEPLLDRSAAELAAYAVETGRSEHPLVRRRAWVPPRQSWNLSLRRPDTTQIAAPMGTKALQ